eukprot:GFUD01008098.1.p1 GENE.GFUD01008098.1~~GFUD01008098.1.p1  ORF type:complete len:976 (+),score=306.08 GFUD01008098.1:309-3236(+)
MDDKIDIIELNDEEEDDKLELVSTNEDLQTIVEDVLEIEKNIYCEASNIVNISTSSSMDQTMFLQPFVDDLEENQELLDEASKVVELLTFDDGQELEQELELSALCLEQIMPRTQSEVELDESEESESENIDDLASEESFAKSDTMDNLLLKRKNLVHFSGGSTDSEMDLGCPLKTKLMQSEKEEYLTNTDSEVPLTDSELAFTDSDCLCTDSEIAPAEEEGSETENAIYGTTVDNHDIDITSDKINIDIKEIELQNDVLDLGEKSTSAEIVNDDSAEMTLDTEENERQFTDKNIELGNLTKFAASSELAETPQKDPVHSICDEEEARTPHPGSQSGPQCNNQASSGCIAEQSQVSASSSGGSQALQHQKLNVEIDQTSPITSSDISQEVVQVGDSRSAAVSAGTDKSYKHKKCQDISTVTDEVEISGEFKIVEDQQAGLDQGKGSEFILLTRAMIEESAVVGEDCQDDEEETAISTEMSKNIINGYLYPGTVALKNENDDSGDEGWGEDIILDNLQVNEADPSNVRTTALESDISQLNESEVPDENEVIDVKEQCNELQQWLEKKEREFDKIMIGDQESSDKSISEKEPSELNNKVTNDVEDLNIQAEILKQITENALSSSLEDSTSESNECIESASKPLECIDEQSVFNPTEEQLLDSNSLLITPMVVEPKVKRKSSSSTPKIKRKNIKSPLLRRKEIRTCINLHNACENSDVLQEIMGPAVSYGSNLNLLEAVENTPDILALEDAQSNEAIGAKPKFDKSSLSGKMSTPGLPWFPWKTLSFLLLISTASIINLDCQKHGSFSLSSTGQFLRDIGQFDRVVTNYQVVLDKSMEGRHWADTNLPLYAEQARRVGGPYYDVAQTKVGEAWVLMVQGWGKLEVAVKAGVVKVEGWVPGAQEQINRVGQAVAVGGKAMWVRGQHVGLVLQQGAVDLVNGDIDWVAVKANAAERAQVVQGQLVAAYNYVQVQINQLVK